MPKSKSSGKGRHNLTPKTRKAMHGIDALDLETPTQPRRAPKYPKKALSYSKKRAASSSEDSDSSSLSELESEDADEEDADEENDDEDDEEEDEEEPSYYSTFLKRKQHAAKSKKGLKTPQTPQSKASRRRRGSDDSEASALPDSTSSDDDVYEAVEDISDSDGEEPDVEQLEEENILAEEVGSQVALSSVADLSEFDDGQLFQQAGIDDYEDVVSAYRHRARSETPARRSVHWADAVDNGNSSDVGPQFIDDDDDEYSDIDPDPRLFEETGTTADFVSQENLDPDLLRMIEEDDHDFSEHYTPYRGQGIILENDTTDGSVSSSGYDTDEGETTDDDLPPTVSHPESKLHPEPRTPTPLSNSGSNDTRQVKTEPPRRRGPMMGSFNVNPRKPVAILDSTGTKLMIRPAPSTNRHDWLDSACTSNNGTANNSPRNSIMENPFDEGDFERSNAGKNIISGDLMMSAVAEGSFVRGQATGPPEAFFAFSQTDFNPWVGSTSDGDDDDDEQQILDLELHDLIDFDNLSDDEDDKADDTDSVFKSPLAPASKKNTQSSTAAHLLHDKNIVTAFRNNHQRYQTFLKTSPYRECLPPGSRMNSALKYARQSETPSRKRKAMAAQQSGNGAVYSAEVVRRELAGSHKRQKSAN